MGVLEVLARIIELIGGTIVFAGLTLMVLPSVLSIFDFDFDTARGCLVGITGLLGGAALFGLGVLCCLAIGIPYQLTTTPTPSTDAIFITIIILGIIIGIVAIYLIKQYSS